MSHTADKARSEVAKKKTQHDEILLPERQDPLVRGIIPTPPLPVRDRTAEATAARWPLPEKDVVFTPTLQVM